MKYLVGFGEISRAYNGGAVWKKAVLCVGIALFIVCVGGCADTGYDDGPVVDYGVDYYEPYCFDYGWWGGGYWGGPPVYGYRGGFGHPGPGFRPGGPRPFRPGSPSRGVPSIPRGPRGGGMRGG